MPPIHPSRHGPIGSAVAVLALLLAAADGVCQEGGGGSHSVSLEFDSETLRLLDDVGVQVWVARDVHRRLGLTSGDELEVDPELRQVVDTTVYVVRQHANSLPVVKLESRLLLDQRGQPIRLFGHHRGFSQPPPPTPSVDVRDILEPLGISEGDLSSQRLVYWPDGTDLREETDRPFTEEELLLACNCDWVSASTCCSCAQSAHVGCCPSCCAFCLDCVLLTTTGLTPPSHYHGKLSHKSQVRVASGHGWPASSAIRG